MFSSGTFSIHSVIGVCISLYIAFIQLQPPINKDAILFVIEFILYKLFVHSGVL